MNLAAEQLPKCHIGTWLSLASPVVAELAGECGFDWVLIDLEHGCGTDADVLPQLQALKGTPTRGIVRVGAPHPELIGRMLDLGAHGIMVPHVSTVAEAEDCVRALHYPPRGHRGFSRSVRAYGYGLKAPVMDEPPLFYAQIETIEAVENARAIAEVDGVDVLFVGPADLQFDLTARPDVARCDFAECLAEVAASATAAGKSAGTLLRNHADLVPLRDQGFTHFAIDSDLGILRSGYQSILKSASVYR